MIKIGKLLTGISLVCVLGACGDDGHDRDETVLDMSYLTGKDWYYNGWLGNKDKFDARDLVEVIRFEQGGALKSMDFGGRRVYTVGRWESTPENEIILKYKNGEEDLWNVQRSGEDYIETIVNGQGSRRYSPKPDYLGELTADAFLVNDYTSGSLRTYIGADIRGNAELQNGGLMLTADGQKAELVSHEYFWNVKNPQAVDFDYTPQEVRFYLRVGKNIHLKLRDSLYASHLPKYLPTQAGLNGIAADGELNVEWNPYPDENVCYRIEVYKDNADDPYFISKVQYHSKGTLKINTNTDGELNEISRLRPGQSYQLRLTAILYEPGIDPWNDTYAYANIQAVAYFNDVFLWK